jgi:steroid delta-isomerase-like uncharacterized protein
MTASLTNQPANVATALDLLDAMWNRGDLSAADRLVDSNHVDHSPDGPEVGRAHFVEDVATYRTAFPDMHMTVEEHISQENRVVLRWSATGTHLGPLQGLPATGRTASVSGIYIHTVVDGRVTDTWAMFDEVGLLRQLGILPNKP